MEEEKKGNDVSSPLPPMLTDIDYDSLSEEEYFREMEKKVEFYKQHYPDMYDKATEWIKMLDHSEVYKKIEEENEEKRLHAQDQGDEESKSELKSELKSEQKQAAQDTKDRERAQDILKNIVYHGLDDDDLTPVELGLVTRFFPDWKDTVSEKMKS
jgi:hypothetical protein